MSLDTPNDNPISGNMIPKGLSMGHGHVIPNPDGTKARCGGPGMCPVCSQELTAKAAAEKASIGEPAHPEVVTISREVAIAADSLLSWIWHRYLTHAERDAAGQAEYSKVISGLRQAYEPVRTS